MLDENQAEPTGSPAPAGDPAEPPDSRPVMAPAADAPGATPDALAGPAPRRHNGRLALAVWLLLLLLPGIAGLVLHLEELAMLVALAGMFIAAQAADVDPQWFPLHSVLSLVVPVGGCVSFAMLAVFVFQGDAPLALRVAAATFCGAASAFALLTWAPPVARWLVERLFRGAGDSQTLRLAARLVALCLLVSLPGALAFQRLMAPLLETPEALTGSRVLGGELLGYLVLALASVGFLVRRDARETFARLGLKAIGVREIGLVLLGAAALFALNGATEWIQHAAFPALWAHDKHVNDALVAGLGARQAMLLGVTAGVGEELTMRGALQPRLGLVLTSALFASLHVQYSWFGMLVVMVIGLALGLLRQRTGTTVCIAVHALYDMAAIFST